MDDTSLESLLCRLRDRRGPELPGAFEQSVWREIRLRNRTSFETGEPFWGWIFNSLLRPQMVAVSLALALAVGVGFGNYGVAPHTAQTRAALDLQVFSSESPALPSTLLSARL